MKRALALWAAVVVLVALGGNSATANPDRGYAAKSAVKTRDCVSCDASVHCQERVAQAGGSIEVVPISNGLMILYNTPVVRKVTDVQNAALDRWGIMDKVIAGKADGHLCHSCEQAKAVIAKADHQVYKTSSGIVALITSDNPDVVREIQKMAHRRREAAPPRS